MFSDDFEKDFKRQRSVFNIVFYGALIMIGVTWMCYIAAGVTALKAVKSSGVSTPADAAKAAGRLFGQFQQGFEEGKKDVQKTP